ncbi:hypothetical protein RB653_004588 [Dictyostelium firmibasis]|uniref:Carbohydrate binding domain-containing protein n=1 Tax=Dictyostelium firmibasis TaxID=79012 RepID=A0AAN7U6B2_9MYCE
MKIFIAIIFILLSISICSSYQCGYYSCLPGHTCTNSDGEFKCVYNKDELIISQIITNSWADPINGPNVQVMVNVINHTHRTIKDIIIATDVKLNNGQIWGAQLNGFLINFPDYVSIAPGKNHTFGYINRGVSAAHLWVQKVNHATA